MPQQQEITQKSRLGTLLLHKKLITRDQLNAALKIQETSELRLGEILIDQGWISASQLNKALSHQKKYRLVATIGAILLGSAQPLLSYAATGNTTSMSISESMGAGGLVPLTDDAMGDITAQGVEDNINFLNDFIDNANNGEEVNAEQALESVLNTLFPAAELFTDYTISGVEYYDGDEPKLTINEDGSIKIQAPKRIGEIAFKDFNTKGGTGPAWGDIIIKDVRMTADSSITISQR